jgi:hypothetical protein
MRGRRAWAERNKAPADEPVADEPADEPAADEPDPDAA